MCPFNEEEIAKMVQTATHEFDNLISQMKGLKDELTILDQISKFTDSVKERLHKIYDEKFPKKCNTCGRIYNSREDFLRETQAMKKGDVIFDKEAKSNQRLQEYRNCVCGSTLVIVAGDRRDNTPFGKARRELFDVCVTKLKEVTKEDDARVRERVRKIFQAFATQYQG
jgi:hypothetical protein